MINKKSEEFKFMREMQKSTNVPIGIASAFFCLFAVFMVSPIYLKQVWWLFLLLAVINFVIIVFLFIPLTNRMNTRRISFDIYDWKRRGFSDSQRTNLLKDLNFLPLKVFLSSLVMCILFIFTWLVFVFSITRLPYFDGLPLAFVDALFMFFSSIYIGYAIALAAMLRAEDITSRYACDLVREGVIVEEKPDSLFGLSSHKRSLLFLVIPVVLYAFETMVVFEHCILHFDFKVSVIGNLRLLILTVVNTLILVVCIKFNEHRPKKIIKAIISNLTENIQKHIFQSIPADLSDQHSYLAYLINKNNKYMQEIFEKSDDASMEITNAVDSLVELSTENSTASIEQSATVRQVVSSMEYADFLSNDISKKTNEVLKDISQNFTYVERGLATLHDSIAKMVDISESNVELINGIENLTKQISTIWDIVNIIDGIAEQAKIIAFNAEIEASSAGKTGKNFHSVANEIRRLAENTSISTNEIKESIFRIQNSFDDLINSSKKGTVNINQGLKFSDELSRNFACIKDSSYSIQSSANDVNGIISKQISSFAQILETLKEISGSIEINTCASHEVSNTALKLQAMADDLNNLKKSNIQFGR